MNNDKLTIALFEKKAGIGLFHLDLNLASEKLFGLATNTAKMMHLEKGEAMCFVGMEQYDYVLARVWFYRGLNRFRFNHDIQIYPTALQFVVDGMPFKPEKMVQRIKLFFRAS